MRDKRRESRRKEMMEFAEKAHESLALVVGGLMATSYGVSRSDTDGLVDLTTSLHVFMGAAAVGDKELAAEESLNVFNKLNNNYDEGRQAALGIALLMNAGFILSKLSKADTYGDPSERTPHSQELQEVLDLISEVEKNRRPEEEGGE